MRLRRTLRPKPPAPRKDALLVELDWVNCDNGPVPVMWLRSGSLDDAERWLKQVTAREPYEQPKPPA